jgi:uncharacterized protein (DUF2147 family)
MKKVFVYGMAILVLLAMHGVSPAAEQSLTGVWSMPVLKGSDKGKERAQVEIFEKDGIYQGKIVKLSKAPANALCKACKDERKNKPLMNMLVLWNLKKEAGRYLGTVFDFDAGKEYKCTVTQISQDKLMITASLLFFSESHYWVRVK